MRQFRPNRMAALVLALLVVASFGASAAAYRVVDDNEARLLVDRVREIETLLQSLGSSYEAQLSAVAAISSVTQGDPAEFEAAVLSVDTDAIEDRGGGWVLMRRGADGWDRAAAVGAPTPQGDLPAAWIGSLDTAMTTGFTILGFVGSGDTRRFAVASGRPEAGEDFVAVREIAMAQASLEVSEARESPISGVAIRVYVGTRPDPTDLLFAMGRFDASKADRRLVNVSGAALYVEVSPVEPLGGVLASQLPRLLLFGGVLLGLSLAAVVEVVQRRRDDAVATVDDLEEQNRRLDAALHEQQVTETARAALEVELRQAQRLEAIGQLAGGVAHDFNNVLAAILSYADLAAEGTTDPTALDDIASIQHAARRGADLTRKLLQFSRRRAGEMSVVDVNERVEDAVRMLCRTLGEDVALRTFLAPGPVNAVVDPVELDQIVLNLVVNARDAIATGGSITIATDVVDGSHMDLPGHSEGNYVRLTVSDDGCGMSPEVVEHAFEPFFTTKGRGEGTGLGLSTVYGIVQGLGGHVVVQSTPGRGTTLVVLLPATSDAPAATEEDADGTPRAAGSGRTVLVVEDEEPLRRALRRMLERAGFLVLEAPDGRSALRDHRRTDIDLLVTDIVMPQGVTGADVAAGFRDRDPELPVVFITGYSGDILGPDQLDAPHTYLLSKPFAESDLLAAVDSALGALQ